MATTLCRWCPTTCMNVEDCDGQQRWMTYWEGLTHAERLAELRAIDEHVRATAEPVAPARRSRDRYPPGSPELANGPVPPIDPSDPRENP